MDVMTIGTVVVAIWAADLPALEIRALAKQVALPAGAAERWDVIGTYTIKERKATATVKLYYADSDSIADKVERKGGIGMRTYPNFFSIHAVYRNGDGPWKYTEMYRVARVGFWKVAEVKPDAVTLQVRSKLILFSNSPIRFTEEERRRIYEPVSMRLTVKDGIPELK
jgi:hypothetical protein